MVPQFSLVPKTVVATRSIQGINSKASIVAVPKRWQESADLLRACDVIFGCVDSFSERQQIETSARRYMTPYIDIGMDVHDPGNPVAKPTPTGVVSLKSTLRSSQESNRKQAVSALLGPTLFSTAHEGERAR